MQKRQNMSTNKKRFGKASNEQPKRLNADNFQIKEQAAKKEIKSVISGKEIALTLTAVAISSTLLVLYVMFKS
jgi:hypothetical protein